MHIYFSGVGGAGIFPCAVLALKLGYSVTGSDLADSPAKFQKLRDLGATIEVGQDGSQIRNADRANNIDWFVYSSALLMHNPDHPEYVYAEKKNIKMSKLNTFLNELTSSNQKQVAIAGTHGKTTTTAMFVWLLKELGLKHGYMVGGEPAFGPAADITPDAEWFVFENDEFDRRFLEFSPHYTILSGVTYDHFDIYPTESDYHDAFRTYISQCRQAYMCATDRDTLYGQSAPENIVVLPEIDGIKLLGTVNRFDASMVVGAASDMGLGDTGTLVKIMNRFPGVKRRFEKITENLYTDYAHTPEKIRGALGVAKESSEHVVVIYEPLHNTRQHRIRDQYKDMFTGIKKLYWVPTFLARENPDQAVLSPKELIADMDNPEIAQPASLDDDLRSVIDLHLEAGDLVLVVSAGGANSLDSWLRQEFKVNQ
ncbi:MAG: Mur ligase domain-containing protein [Patescibacteria group bacterium]